MAFIETFDTATPPGSQDRTLGDDRIRELKRSIQERMAIDHAFPLVGTTMDGATVGYHNKLTLIDQVNNLAAVAGATVVFSKTVSGVIELFLVLASGTVVQLTSGGKLLMSSLVIASEARGDLMVRGASLWGRLGLGGNNTFLKSDGTDASWATINFQTAASQAQMEAASDNTVPVTPLSMNWHPGLAKAWCSFNGTGTPAMIVSYNMDATFTDNGVGGWTVSITTDFSSGNYCMTASCQGASGVPNIYAVVIKDATTPAAGSINVQVFNDTGILKDVPKVNLAFFGDQ